VRYRGLGEREQYANIEHPKPAQTIPNHLCYKAFTLSDIH